MITPDEIAQLVRSQLPDAKVEVKDLTGGGDHFAISVASSAFAGRSLIEQHKMVFAALGDEMDRRIHAVQLKTKTL